MTAPTRDNLIELEDRLLGKDAKKEIAKIKIFLHEEENKIKKLRFKGCSPDKFKKISNQLKAIDSAFRILEKFDV